MSPDIALVVSQAKQLEKEADALIAQAVAEGADPETIDAELVMVGWGKPMEWRLVERCPSSANPTPSLANT